MPTIIYGEVSDKNAKTVEIINGQYPEILISECHVQHNNFALPIPTGVNIDEHPVSLIVRDNGDILKKKDVMIKIGSINEVNL